MHVMSETSACFTMAQGAALVEAVEKSGRIYMFAENYPYMLFNQEMRRLYQAGAVGQFVYGEGEYVHPSDADFWNSISPGASHWRNWLPSTYYCTHALGPLMFITDTRPVKVNACSMPYRGDDPVSTRRANCNDAAAILTVRMDSGAVVKLIQFHMRGEGNWVRVHGSTGQMENLRQGNTNMVRLRREQYHQNAAQARKFAAGGGGATTDQIYLPTWPREHQAAAAAAGHGGGDYFMNYHFSQAIRTGRQPFLDVYRGVAMSMVGIQGWRSVLDDSNTYEIPDFRDTSARRKYAKDHWNPDPVQHTKDMPWPSILGNIRPSKAGLAYAKKVWRRCGYFGE
jgi:predicted dehydrogenase